jgi:hypothetical protein
LVQYVEDAVTEQLGNAATEQSAPSSTRSRWLPLLVAGGLAGAVASLLTVAVAAAAQAADVSLEIAGKAVPLSAFPFWTMIGAAAGVILAATLRHRRRFIRTTLAATGLSLVPPIFGADDAPTALVLVATHLIAAAIIIPALNRMITSP